MFKILLRLRTIILSFLIVFSPHVIAGFLEMPDISDVPDLERKSMLKDLDIPSVRQRDPDPEAGPRLNVEKFLLQGIVEYPDLGITKQDIDEQIEKIRFDLMKEYKITKSGYTEKELEQISDLLGQIEDETRDRHVSDVDLQKLIWLVRDQRSKRGITLGQIESVADRITKYYREKGFILAKAYIPQQHVRNGIVALTLLLGKLGEVQVHDNKLYKADYLKAPFDDMLTQPVTSSGVEERLYLINDFPGVTVTGFFEPGAQVGDTRLNLNVRSQNSHDASLRLDNHGSEQTGRYRLYGEWLQNNPLGHADQLKIAGLLAAQPSNTVYGEVRYSSRVWSPRLDLSAGFANNDFVLGPGNSESINNLKLEGQTRQRDVTATYRFKRSRTRNFYGDLTYEKIDSIIRLGALPGTGDAGLDDTIHNVSMNFRYDVLDEKNKILHQGDVKLTSGAFDKGAEIGQDENYNIMNLDYTLLTFWKIPYFESNTRLIYRASLQYASSPLSSISQFSLAGPTQVRAYPVNQFSADNAVYMGLDWLFDAPEFFDMKLGNSNLRNMVQPFLFTDGAWGEVLSLVDGQDNTTAKLMDAGFGFQFTYLNKVKGNLLFAFPLRENFSSPDTQAPGDSFRLVFDVQYRFR